MKAATLPVTYYNGNPYISIHAAREGGDCFGIEHFNICFISIHAAREGGDVCILSDYITNMVFQSTPPVKAATR